MPAKLPRERGLGSTSSRPRRPRRACRPHLELVLGFLLKSAFVIALVYFALHKDEIVASLARARGGSETATGGERRAVGVKDDALTGLQRAAAAKLAGAARALSEAGRRAEESAKEILGLRHIIEASPSAEPAEVLWALVTERTKAGLAFLRDKIPENHPALAWFDKTVEIATQLGCLAVKAS